MDIITDKFKQECSDAERENLERLAWRLYGLVHARYILTPRGLQKMNEKFRNYDFGKCPRYNCKNYPLLPIGLHDIPAQSTVKLYCAKCEDLYVPKSSRHAAIDGAYFGSSFPGMLLQAYPNEVERSREKYLLKIFGFKLHDRAELARIQEKYNQEAEKEFKRLEKEGLWVSLVCKKDINEFTAWCWQWFLITLEWIIINTREN